jgi:hypothetical protein
MRISGKVCEAYDKMNMGKEEYLLKDEKVMSSFCHSGLPGIFLQKDSRQAGVTD